MLTRRCSPILNRLVKVPYAKRRAEDSSQPQLKISHPLQKATLQKLIVKRGIRPLVKQLLRMSSSRWSTLCKPKSTTLLHRQKARISPSKTRSTKMKLVTEVRNFQTRIKRWLRRARDQVKRSMPRINLLTQEAPPWVSATLHRLDWANSKSLLDKKEPKLWDWKRTRVKQTLLLATKIDKSPKRTRAIFI